MRILHITPETNGYEEVEMLANRVSDTNGFVPIRKNGEDFMTGGFTIRDTPQIRKMLDSFPKKDQYQLMCDLRLKPYMDKQYIDEDE